MYHLSELYEDFVFCWQEMVYFMKVRDQNVEYYGTKIVPNQYLNFKSSITRFAHKVVFCWQKVVFVYVGITPKS